MATPSGSTTQYGFPYLEESDVPDVATASQVLAQAVENLLKKMRIGQIGSCLTATAPTGAVLLQGQAVTRTGTYAALYAKWGTTYGTGNGSTTFNLPNMEQKVQAGYKSGDATFGTLGATVGANTVTLTTGQIPKMNASVTDPGHAHGTTDGGHTHTAPGGYEFVVGELNSTLYLNHGATGSHTSTGVSFNGHTHTNTTGLTINSATTGLTATVGATSPTAVSNIQKTIVVNFYAYYK